MTATTIATTAPIATVPRTTQPIASSNIAWLDAVSVPCSAIRSANERLPTIITPAARIAIAMPATTSAARAILTAIPPGRPIIAGLPPSAATGAAR